MENADFSDSAILRLGPEKPQSPLVISVPHGGRHYPTELFKHTRLSETQLRALEDRYTDKLVTPLAEDGITIIIAKTARAWIDLNRSEREIDPDMVLPRPMRASLELTAKVRGGLGLIPRRLSGHGDIYRAPMGERHIGRRIAESYRPYHATISDTLSEARARYGSAILLDCHSMPPLRAKNGQAPSQIVLGDRQGQSAAPSFAAKASAISRAAGYRVARNMPYAGGHILSRHGNPERNIHALQLEICRSLYLDAERVETGPNFEQIVTLIRRIAEGLIEEAFAHPESLAAE